MVSRSPTCSLSTSRIETPLWAGATSGSVLQSSAIRPERRALEIQVFDPFTR